LKLIENIITQAVHFTQEKEKATCGTTKHKNYQMYSDSIKSCARQNCGEGIFLARDLQGFSKRNNSALGYCMNK